MKQIHFKIDKVVGRSKYWLNFNSDAQLELKDLLNNDSSLTRSIEFLNMILQFQKSWTKKSAWEKIIQRGYTAKRGYSKNLEFNNEYEKPKERKARPKFLLVWWLLAREISEWNCKERYINSKIKARNLTRIVYSRPNKEEYKDKVAFLLLIQNINHFSLDRNFGKTHAEWFLEFYFPEWKLFEFYLVKHLVWKSRNDFALDYNT